jgi:hypothetical protein
MSHWTFIGTLLAALMVLAGPSWGAVTPPDRTGDAASTRAAPSQTPSSADWDKRAYSACVPAAMQQGASADGAARYCSCALQKLDVVPLPQRDALGPTSPELRSAENACRSLATAGQTPIDAAQWDRDMYSSCIPAAMRTGAAADAAERYCKCAEQQLDALTPQQKQALDAASPELMAAAERCRPEAEAPSVGFVLPRSASVGDEANSSSVGALNAQWEKATTSSCISGAARTGASADSAVRYCSCVVQQLDTLTLRQKQALGASSPELTAAVNLCRPQVGLGGYSSVAGLSARWNQATYGGCITTAKQTGASEEGAARYCGCLISEWDALTLKEKEALSTTSPEFSRAVYECRPLGGPRANNSDAPGSGAAVAPN